MGEHLCHAEGCTTPVPPRMLMCRRHWRMVPRALQAAVWAEYVPGQERRKDPTESYLDAAHEAIRAVAAKEGRVLVEADLLPDEARKLAAAEDQLQTRPLFDHEEGSDG